MTFLIYRSDPHKVKLSKQGSESSCKGIVNNLQFSLIKVGGSKDFPGLKLCNIQTDSVDDNFTKIDSKNDNLSFKAPIDDGTAVAVDDLITKNDNRQIDVTGNGSDASDDDMGFQKYKELSELDSPSNNNIELEETVYSNTEDNHQVNVKDDLSENWKEMALGLQFSKVSFYALLFIIVFKK